MEQQAPTLFDIIAYVETKCNYHGLRFEPTVYGEIESQDSIGKLSSAKSVILWRIQEIHNVSRGTARMIYSTSFGATQIMGFNLYAPGGTNLDCVTFCETPNEQSRMFNAFCSVDEIAYAPATLYNPAERLRFALKYNGAASYANLILDALYHLGVKQ